VDGFTEHLLFGGGVYHVGPRCGWRRLGFVRNIDLMPMQTQMRTQIPMRMQTQMRTQIPIQMQILPDGVSGTLHIILDAKDNGDPTLSSYRRVVIDVAQ
jgi:hypothetical protein